MYFSLFLSSLSLTRFADTAWTAFIVTGIVTFFKGFDTFIRPASAPITQAAFNYKSFITNYLGIPVFTISACPLFPLLHS